MSLQQNLLKIALLGTERQTEVPHADANVQPYLIQLYPNGQVPTDEARERAFLNTVALVGQYQAVGRLPATFSGTLPLPDDSHKLALIPTAADIHLRRMLADSTLRPLLNEWLVQVAGQSLRVPVSFMPSLMEQARQSKAIRAALSTVIGQRGHWLIQQNADWHNILTQTPNDEQDVSIWEEGSLEQRSEYLQRLRSHNPLAARECLQAVWKQESASVRQELLEAWRINLSLADEAWLESCLDDRSKGVRQLAAELLGALPDSAFSQRMRTRLESWLVLGNKPGLLGKLTGKKQLQANVPENWDKAWLRDGIEEKPPRGKGNKAWWLEQALIYVPPIWWSQYWQLTPAELLVLAKDSDWKDALLAGWEMALLHYPNREWAQVWLARSDPLHSPLWKVLVPAEAEATARALLQDSDSLGLLDILSHLHHAWSLDFSQHILKQLQTRITRKRNIYPYSVQGALRQLALCIDIVCVDDFADLLQEPLQATDHPFHRILTDILSLLRFRAEALSALKTIASKDQP
ncbi:DUF5691 domain-containing protein [Thiofilum flexile]|uniref:DUF5691 domain-containing protein n=1 Tax=Thiofilum flexile TaxID=125627 RepID=UPI00035CEA98|nr:DUF5691 domain-containing protein [Thiofilum flexile]